MNLVPWRRMAAVLLLLTAALAVRAQSPKLAWTVGCGALPFRSSAPAGQFSTEKATLPHLVVGASYDRPLRSFGDEQALGLSVAPQAGLFGMMLLDATGDDVPEAGFTLDIPVYVTYRYGARATSHSTKSFGGGVGAGVRPGYMFWGMADEVIIRGYVQPNIMLEGTYSTTRCDLFLRLSTDLSAIKYYNTYTSSGREVAATYRSVLLQLGMTFF